MPHQKEGCILGLAGSSYRYTLVPGVDLTRIGEYTLARDFAMLPNRRGTCRPWARLSADEWRDRLALSALSVEGKWSVCRLGDERVYSRRLPYPKDPFQHG